MNNPPPLASFVDSVGRPYLEKTGYQADLSALKGWRPTRSLWNLVRQSQTTISGLRRRHLWIDDHRVTYLEGGRREGEVVMLLHGFGASKENWLLLAGLLASRYRLLIPDLPGFGESHFMASDNYRLATQAERVARMIRQLDCGPVHLVGNSMGGAIAGITAARFADRVRSLTLMNAAGVRGSQASPFEHALISGHNPLIPTNMMEVANLFRTVTRRNRHALAAVLTPIMYREMAHRAPVNQRIFADLLQIDEPAEQVFSGIRQPTLVMWGDGDAVLDVSCADSFIQLIPHARKRVFPGVGHLPMLEAPALTAHSLRKLWRETRS